MNETTKINHVRFNNHIIKANYYSPYPILKSLKQSDSLLKLYVCKSCFKYFLNRSWFKKHFAKCQVRPPGRLVYNDHEHNLKIYKIDGSLNKVSGCVCMYIFIYWSQCIVILSKFISVW